MQDRMSAFYRIPLFFALFVALGLIFGFITFKILSFSRTVTVPALTGMSVVEANDLLAKTGLYLKIEGEDFDSSVPSGRIVRQDEPQGSKVKEKRSIKVVISKGPKVQSLPQLVDQPLGEAESLLMQKGLRIGKVIRVHSDAAEAGFVIAQRPTPDEKPGDSITVLVSLGPHEVTYYCPDFSGMTADTAKELAAKMGLILEIKGQGAAIVSQKPKAGSPVKSSDKITLDTQETGSHG